jgi:hypothetical protein
MKRSALTLEGPMKTFAALLIPALIITVLVTPLAARDLKQQVKVEIESVGLHPGMDPGMYVCAGGHLHIKGTVQNMTSVAIRQVKVAGRAFDAEGKLLGTAVTTTKAEKVAPGQKAEINLEFLTVTGQAIRQVKRHEVTVVEAPSM